jgi:hypothetical protein
MGRDSKEQLPMIPEALLKLAALFSPIAFLVFDDFF